MTNARAAKVINITAIKAACKDCNLRELCLPLGLDGTDIEALDNLIKRRRLLKKCEHLYRLGDPLRALYAVRSGTFKSTGLMEDGRAHVTGFYLPGELLGLDAINTDKHPCNAEALESAEVCELPFSALENLAHQIPGLQRQMLKLMSREIVRDEHTLMMLGRMSAEERLASCLVSFGQRSKRLGGDGGEFVLSMSRQDIGDYLGLALETVSRLFTRFREDGLIDVDGRHLRVRDHARLHALATGSASSPHESGQRA